MGDFSDIFNRLDHCLSVTIEFGPLMNNMFIDIGSIYAVIRSILVIYTSDNRDKITFSSFQDTNSQKKKFDDKYWTLIVENVS